VPAHEWGNQVRVAGSDFSQAKAGQRLHQCIAPRREAQGADSEWHRLSEIDGKNEATRSSFVAPMV
jgi:hypothetical protein